MRRHRGATTMLPVSRAEMASLGWDRADIILVTGDAYVDHPSFGVAIIGRWLESHGYRVAILAQPRYQEPGAFEALGRPRLFFGVSSGNLDSVVANYTGNCRIRRQDAYCPDGDPYFPGLPPGRAARRRPDRALLTYCNGLKACWPDVPVVLGGIEASLRRFIHYDFQQGRLRGSVLDEAKADLLVYGMGERAMLEIARRLDTGKGLNGIPGTCQLLGAREAAAVMDRLDGASYTGEELASVAILPSWDEVSAEPASFLQAEAAMEKEARHHEGWPILQRQKSGRWVLQNRRARPLSTQELDALYELPYARRVHPSFGDVPAYRMIRHSVTVVRGCCGNCSFCAISRHQGPGIVSRSIDSVAREVEAVAAMPDFGGTITDLGGPTANLYGATCRRQGRCVRRDCLYPRPCPHLDARGGGYERLLEEVSRRPGVRHLFVSSGLRMDLLERQPRLLARIVRHHTPGALKIAPEHTEDEVLALMHKPGGGLLERFLRLARSMKTASGQPPEITAYLMTSHPGCTLDHMEAMAKRLRRLRLAVRQFQDFTPTPGTISTAMFVSGRDPEGRPIHVPRGGAERRRQRAILEAMMPRGEKGSRGLAGKRRGRSRAKGIEGGSGRGRNGRSRK